MANLILHKETGLHSLAISAAPCGHCRQFYSELACAVSGMACLGRLRSRALLGTSPGVRHTQCIALRACCMHPTHLSLIWCSACADVSSWHSMPCQQQHINPGHACVCDCRACSMQVLCLPGFGLTFAG